MNAAQLKPARADGWRSAAAGNSLASQNRAIERAASMKSSEATPLSLVLAMLLSVTRRSRASESTRAKEVNVRFAP
jgi:hypothetical protein